MEVRVIASSHVGHEAEKGKFDEFSGKLIGLKNTPDNLKALMYEDNAKALRRSEIAKKEMDKAFFDHENITLYFENLPKIVSIILDSEKCWAKTEKDSKFTESYFSKDEELIYNKWVDLFKGRIAKIYKDKGQVCTDKMQENLAGEYAVYLKSIFTPVTAVYTVSYGDYNRTIALFENYIAKEKDSDLENKLSAILIEFVMKLKSLPYYDKDLSKSSDSLKVFNFNDVEEYFGDVYATTYSCSLVALSELLLNRDSNIQIKLTENEFYIPSIIAENNDLKELWLSDIMTLGNYPLSKKVIINEMSTIDTFINKVKENNINEINNINKDILDKYEYSLRLKIHKRAEELIKLKK